MRHGACSHLANVSCWFIVHRFIDSEADLDLALKALLPLAQSPVLAYPEIVRTGTIERLVGLLSHENMDIVIDVVEVINEFTDDDEEAEPDEEEEEGSREEALKQLLESLVSGLQCSLCCTRLTERLADCPLCSGIAS